MGSADFNTGMKISGTREECFAALNVVKRYATENHNRYIEKRDCAYLNSAYVSNDKTSGFGNRLDTMSDEDVYKFIDESNCVVLVDASGPYGRFGFLDEVDLFYDIAEEVPGASIVGGMGGFSTGGDQNAAFELKDGLLYCKYATSNEDDWDENDEDWDEDEDDDWEDEEPEWDEEFIYDPVKKKNVKE